MKATRLNFDVHRAGGIWLWPALFVLAASSVYLNLTHKVFVPTVEWLARTLLPEELRGPTVDAVTEWQYPLHTGEALGFIGQVIVFVTGLAIAAFSITGLVTTWRKLRPRPRIRVGHHPHP